MGLRDDMSEDGREGGNGDESKCHIASFNTLWPLPYFLVWVNIPEFIGSCFPFFGFYHLNNLLCCLIVIAYTEHINRESELWYRLYL